jgi:L-rhamnonate dehydratase
MKITDVKVIYVTLPEIKERCDGSQDALLVFVETDAGITGIGEVDSSPPIAKATINAPFSSTITDGLRNLVIGENPFEYEKIWQKMYLGSRYPGRRGAVIHAMSGIDMALWDIMGKALNMPVYQLLGGGFRKSVRAYASTLFGETIQETADRAKWLVDQGFTAVKFGWDPLGEDLDQDEALVEAIREAVGPKVDVLIDAGHAYNTKTAIQMARRFAEYDIYWLEEPLFPDNLDGYARLSKSTHLRIAAGEAESNRHSYVDLMDRGKIDVVQFDVTRSGGLTETKKIAYAAFDRGLEVVNHSFTTDLNIAASLAILSAVPEANLFEYCVEDSPLRQELVRNPIRPIDGYVSVPEEPGLGVEIDPEVVERYAVEI